MRNLILIAALAVSPAQAVTGWVDLHLGSEHDNTSFDVDGEHYDLNENNLGIGLTLDEADNPYMSTRFGLYKNSYNATTYYAGLNPHTDNRDLIGAGLTVGLASGYGGAPGVDSSVIPIIVPYIALQGQLFRAELSYVHGHHAKAIGLSVGIRF